MPANVFTYGSLMFAPVWNRVVAGSYRSAPARARGYRRFAVRGASYPAVLPDAPAAVIGRVYFDVAGDDLARLDAFEGDEYRRDTIAIELLDPDVDPVDPAPAPRGPSEGATTQASLYVFLVRERVSPDPWNARRFALEQIDRFIATYAGGDWPAR